MKILLTGATSFTGMWFAKTLAEAGHEVVATLQGKKDHYQDLKLKRLKVLESLPIQFVDECSFGDQKFIEIINEGIDSLNHHGANVENYKSIDFDVLKATADNTNNIRKVLEACKDKGAKQIVLTGSVFEQDEGAGTEPLEAFSPYGLSKGLTYQIIRYWCSHYKFKLKKFVIPNPFGPYEEKRFCDYIWNNIKNKTQAVVSTPDYIRDNIHVKDLAVAYRTFVESDNELIANPSGYVCAQGEFAKLFCNEITRRTNRTYELKINAQSEFCEPLIRTNTTPVKSSEEENWDSLVKYYEGKLDVL